LRESVERVLGVGDLMVNEEMVCGVLSVYKAAMRCLNIEYSWISKEYAEAKTFQSRQAQSICDHEPCRL